MLHPLDLKLIQGFLNCNTGSHGGKMPVLIGYDSKIKTNKIYSDDFWEKKESLVFKCKCSLEVSIDGDLKISMMAMERTEYKNN